MTRQPHARPARRIRDRARYAILSRWPLRWWYRLSDRQRDWWVEEYNARHPIEAHRVARRLEELRDD
jgi:hypothetical protein